LPKDNNIAYMLSVMYEYGKNNCNLFTRFYFVTNRITFAAL
jgi:hypothetical protein